MMMFALKVLAPLLVLIAVLQGCTHQARQIDKLKALASDYKVASEKWEGAAGAWKANFKEAERLRGEEREDAREHANALTASCTGRVARARQDAKAAASLIARPIKADPKGCAVPALWGKKDMQPSLGGWK